MRFGSQSPLPRSSIFLTMHFYSSQQKNFFLSTESKGEPENRALERKHPGKGCVEKALVGRWDHSPERRKALPSLPVLTICPSLRPVDPARDIIWLEQHALMEGSDIEDSPAWSERSEHRDKNLGAWKEDEKQDPFPSLDVGLEARKMWRLIYIQMT